MNHPEISTYNANLYYARMLKDAEDHRRAKKLASQKPNGNILMTLVKRLPAVPGKSLNKSTTPTA